MILSVRELFMNEHAREKALEELPDLPKLDIEEVSIVCIESEMSNTPPRESLPFRSIYNGSKSWAKVGQHHSAASCEKPNIFNAYISDVWWKV